MAIQDTILSTPVDIAALQAANKTREALCDGAFTNLLYYAKVHWSYTASGAPVAMICLPEMQLRPPAAVSPLPCAESL